MNNRILNCLLLIALIYTNGCTKEKPLSLPELNTAPLAYLTSTSAISGGKISSDGGASISARGVCWATHSNPTIFDYITSDGKGAGSFKSSVTGLMDGTYYYIRAYSTNTIGTAYGNEYIFMTPLTDIDGNIYKTVIIETQVWMAENLKTTKYNDNTAIENISDNTTWGTLSTPAFCWYKDDVSTNKDTYGALYNWFAVNTDKLCPFGWHVPSEKEWTKLTDYLGGEEIASGILKEAGTLHWNSPNLGATDYFGFTARPGGYRTGLTIGSFRAKGYLGYWWTSTEDDLIGARGRLMRFDEGDIILGTGLKRNGFSVRCLKDK
jgi:uncharacterized protein (TIGR02145 family)